MEGPRQARSAVRLRVLLVVVPLAIGYGEYLRWALRRGTDFGYFTLGWRTLTSAHAVHGLGVDYESFYTKKPGHLHLYTSLTSYHLGPLSLLWGALPRGPVADHLAQLLGLALGVVACRAIWGVVRDGGAAQRRAGAVMVLAVFTSWTDAAVRWVHPDVEMPALLMVFATIAVRAGRARRMGILFGIACATSLTSALFLPLFMALGRGRPRRVALAWASGVGGIFWLPFVVAAPATLRYLDAADSTTRGTIWGLVATGSSTSPAVGVRLLQTAVGLAAAAWFLYRRDAPRALVVVGLLRVALDSADWSYMLLLLIVAGVMADLLQQRPFQAKNTLACVAVALAPQLAQGDDVGRAMARSVAVVVALWVVVPHEHPRVHRAYERLRAAVPAVSSRGRSLAVLEQARG